MKKKSPISYFKVKERISENNQRERDFLSSLYALNQKIKKNHQKRTRFSESLFVLQIQSQKMARQIVSLEKKVEMQKKAFQRRMRHLYKLSHIHYLEILFSSLNPLDWEKNFKYLKEMSQRNSTQIKHYKNTLSSFALKKKELIKSVKRLIVTKQKLKRKEKELENIQTEKKALLQALRRKKRADLNALKWARNKSQKEFWNKKEILALLKPSFFEFKGQLPFPVKGFVSIPYGVTGDPVYDFPVYHKGEFYSVTSPSVYSVYNGKIGFVGSLNGYRHVVILDHGDHYYSVYANLSRTFVKEGDRVQQSQILGKVLTSQSSKKENKGFFSFPRFKTAGLYFEIRHFSDALDPNLWLKKRQAKKDKKTKEKSTVLNSQSVQKYFSHLLLGVSIGKNEVKICKV